MLIKMVITIFTVLDYLLHFVTSFLKKKLFNILISEVKKWLMSVVYQDVQVATRPIKILKKIALFKFPRDTQSRKKG